MAYMDRRTQGLASHHRYNLLAHLGDLYSKQLPDFCNWLGILMTNIKHQLFTFCLIDRSTTNLCFSLRT